MSALIKSFPKEMEELIEISHLCYERNLVSAAGGNVSVRAGAGLLITASGVSLRDVCAEDIIYCSMSGELLVCREGLKPSKETPFHLNVYRSRENVNAVIHVHPDYSTLWSLEGTELPLYTASAHMKLVKVPLIGPGKPGSPELAEKVRRAVAEEYPEAFAFLMAEHGALIMGDRLRDTFDTAELLESSAKIAVIHKLMQK